MSKCSQKKARHLQAGFYSMKKEYKVKTKNFKKLMSYLKKETKTLISDKNIRNGKYNKLG